MTLESATRRRILDTAAELFAAHGFRQVTVRDICREARVNVAAVNYHFGDKLGLYQEVVQQAIDAMRETTDIARREGSGLPAEERLSQFVALLVSRLLSRAGPTIHRLVHREISDPTPALERIVEEGVRPRVEYLSGLVAELLSCSPTDQRVLRCVFSVQTQALACVPNPIAERLGYAHSSAHGEAIARHIAQFSLAGIRGLAEEPALRRANRAVSRRRRPIASARKR